MLWPFFQGIVMCRIHWNTRSSFSYELLSLFPVFHHAQGHQQCGHHSNTSSMTWRDNKLLVVLQMQIHKPKMGNLVWAGDASRRIIRPSDEQNRVISISRGLKLWWSHRMVRPQCIPQFLISTHINYDPTNHSLIDIKKWWFFHLFSSLLITKIYSVTRLFIDNNTTRRNVLHTT